MQDRQKTGKYRRTSGFDCMVIAGGLVNLLVAIYLVTYWLLR